MLLQNLLTDGLDEFFFRGRNIVRDDHIEDQIRVALSGDHAEIMDRDTLVDRFGKCSGLILKLHEIFVFRIDRIHVDDGLAVQFARQVELDIIDHIVDIKHILESGYFRVKRDHLPARAVVVDDDIMDAGDGLMGHDDLFDLVEEFPGRRRAEQRLDRIPRGIDAGVEDKYGERDTDICIDRKVGELRGDDSEKNDGRGDHVVSAVDGGRAHGGGIDDLRPVEVVVHHVSLHEKRGDQDRNSRDRAVNSGRVDDALDRRLSEFKAHDADEKGHQKTRDVLDTAVTERMVGVRCFSRETETDHGDDRRSGIRQVIQRITDDRDRVRQDAHDEFSDEKKDIEKDPAGSADTADAAADFRILGLFIVRHEFSDKKRNHNYSFLECSIHYNRVCCKMEMLIDLGERMDHSTEKALERVARLSGLSLSEEEKEILFSDLSHIIPYMERITGLDTEEAAGIAARAADIEAADTAPGADATAEASDMTPDAEMAPAGGEMLLREDVEEESGLSSAILSSAPEVSGNMFCVPKTVE